MNAALTLALFCALACGGGGTRTPRTCSGHVERERCFRSSGDDIVGRMVTTGHASLVRCVAFCLAVAESNWICNVKVNPSGAQTTCEALALNGSVVYDTDFVSYPGSSVVYDSGMVRAGVQMIVTCSIVLNVWIDGTHVLTEYRNDASQNPPITETLDIPLTTKVIALECNSEGNQGGMIAGLSSGEYTDTTWLCAYPDEGDPVDGWIYPGFDDSAWDTFKVSSNGEEDVWRHVEGIPVEANWIWAAGFGWLGFSPSQNRVYCRKEDENECLCSPCQNGGTCTNIFGSYLCTCALGYWGRHCEGGMS